MQFIVGFGLTDAGKLFAGKHVHHSCAADTRVHHHETGMIGANFADDRRAFSKRMCAHGGKNPVRFAGWNDRESLSFVRHVKRIESENFTGAFHISADRDPRFVEQHPDLRGFTDFAQSAGDPAARWIAQRADIFARGEHRLDQPIQRGSVARNFGFKLQPLPHGHNCDPMHGNRPADDDFVAGSRTPSMDIDAIN